VSHGRRPHHQGIHVYAIDADADEIAVEAVESSGENHVDTTGHILQALIRSLLPAYTDTLIAPFHSFIPLFLC
jgi:hypothetical protein